MKLSIVVPCYNEEMNIPIILNKFSSVINRNDVEIILVNNGSSDNSKNVMNKLAPDYPFAKILHIDVNHGYGSGILAGLRVAGGEFIGYTHADMQTDPADVLIGLKIIERQKNPKICYLKGVRKGRPAFDQVFSIGMSFFESLYLGKKLWDINAQPNIFHKDFFADIMENCPKDFSLDLYLLYMAQLKGLILIRFDVVFPDRVYGISSWNDGLSSKLKFIKRTLKFSFELKRLL